MENVFKILRKQLELNDRADSYHYNKKIGEKVMKDEKGGYLEVIVTREVPCKCHPETCTHFSGKITITEKHKQRIKK